MATCSFLLCSISSTGSEIFHSSSNSRALASVLAEITLVKGSKDVLK